jgi:hypothetical protein
MRRRPRIAVWVLAIGCAAAVIGIEYKALSAAPAPGFPRLEHSPAAPLTPPPARVCGNNAILRGGPTSAPPGSVTVPPGNNADVNWGRARTTYWLAPGIHTLGRGVYDQIIPGSGSTYIGAPGAVVDGQHLNNTAFGGNVANVTVKYLTIQNFSTPGNQGAVNASAAAGWKILYNTVQKVVPGTAVYAGTSNVVEFNCLAENGQSGFGTYTVHDTSSLTEGARNIVISHNEVARNDTCNWEALPKWPGPALPRGCQGVSAVPGCGCSGGGKFWQVDGGEFNDNFVHDNYSVGVWWDSNNTGFDIEGNYISGNYSYGLIYEISYNALIRHNTFSRNGLVTGPMNPGFPTSAIYISESGSDRRVPGKYQDRFLITENAFDDNWSGVILWENSNRFCNSPANTTGGDCTLVDPATVKIASCSPSNISRMPYYDDCRWKTRNVLVNQNTFFFSPDDIGPSCTVENRCGFQGIFSEFGTYPAWSPYKGTIVENHLTLSQNNHFLSNTYVGPWHFIVYDQGDVVNWADWQVQPYSEDAGSTFNPDWQTKVG